MRSLSLKIIYRNDEESVTRKNIGRFKRQLREMPSKILISNDGPSVGSKKFEHCEIKPLKIFGVNDGEFIEEKNIWRHRTAQRGSLENQRRQMSLWVRIRLFWRFLFPLLYKTLILYKKVYIFSKTFQRQEYPSPCKAKGSSNYFSTLNPFLFDLLIGGLR